MHKYSWGFLDRLFAIEYHLEHLISKDITFLFVHGAPGFI